MIECGSRLGVIVPDWDALRNAPAAFNTFVNALETFAGGKGVFVLSLALTMAGGTALRDFYRKSYVTGARLMSPARLHRLSDAVYAYADGVFTPVAAPPVNISMADSARTPARVGYIVSNGFGLGHVTRMRAFAQGLAPHAQSAFMSFSAAMWRDVFYMPSQQYLQLEDDRGNIYTREAAMRFLAHTAPTHVIYDGNAVPEGILSALAAHPHIHLTWVRRGMWQPNVAARHMAAQAMADLLIEPGDLSDAYDTGPTMNALNEYCPPRAFLKTAPVRALAGTALDRADALAALGLAPGRRYALLMLGACQKSEDASVLNEVVSAVLKVPGLTPVIAHWPMSHDRPPAIAGAVTIERMPIADFYPGFDVLISAAGYNSFHEILEGGYPVIFIPQEDAGRDQQLARAQWAVDNGLAQLCRRTDLASLGAIIPNARAGKMHKTGWLADWSPIAGAMGLPAGTPRQPEPQPLALPIKRLHKLLRQCHRHHARKAYPVQFIVATDMDADTFFRKMRSVKQDLRTIVITNSIEPVALRRAEYPYLWLNESAMTGDFAARRQFLAWMRVWRPRRIRFL